MRAFSSRAKLAGIDAESDRRPYNADGDRHIATLTEQHDNQVELSSDWEYCSPNVLNPRGELAEVLQDSWIYQEHQTTSTIVGRRRIGEHIEVLGYDATRRWCRVMPSREGVQGTGWMVLDHDMKGAMLRLVEQRCELMESPSKSGPKKEASSRPQLGRKNPQAASRAFAAAPPQFRALSLPSTSKATASNTKVAIAFSTETIATLESRAHSNSTLTTAPTEASSAQLVGTREDSSLPDDVVGMLFEVIDRFPLSVRREPRWSAEVLAKKRRGQVVQILDTDAAMKWGQVEVETATGLQIGWLLMVSDDGELLLRPYELDDGNRIGDVLCSC